MKILFINNFNGPDYLNDCVFHGLNQIDDLIIECTSNPYYMLSSYPYKNKLYGKGFTVFCTLNITPKIENTNTILEKINNKYYDKIIYGSVHRDISFIEHVLKIYNKDKIVFLDGEDHTFLKNEYITKGKYFKRELVEHQLGVEEISFAIPEEKILKIYPNKEKIFATVIPGNLKTYIFDDEQKYYADYSGSYYGITCKKGGWDCMRHYEILGCYTIPCFYNLEDCPKTIMSNFPKKLILEINEFSLKNKIHPNYKELNIELHNYTLNNLTTKILAKRVLQ